MCANVLTLMSNPRRCYVIPDSNDNRQLSGRSPTRPSTVRALFGARRENVDTNRELVRTELALLAAQDRLRWNFDFETETPLPGRYEWTPVLRSVPPTPTSTLDRLSCRLAVGHVEIAVAPDSTSDVDRIEIRLPHEQDQVSSSDKVTLNLRQTQIKDFLRSRKRNMSASTATSSQPVSVVHSSSPGEDGRPVKVKVRRTAST